MPTLEGTARHRLRRRIRTGRLPHEPRTPQASTTGTTGPCSDHAPREERREGLEDPGFSSEAPGRPWLPVTTLSSTNRARSRPASPRDQQLYQNLKLGHRLPMPDGSPNREFIAGTPRRRPFVRELLAKVEALVLRGLGVLVTGSTRDNAGNLARLVPRRSFPSKAHSSASGDRRHAPRRRRRCTVEAGLDRGGPCRSGTRVHGDTAAPHHLRRPAAGEAPTSDEVGIIGVGAKNRRAYVLGDWTTRGMPDVWADRVVDAAVAVGAARSLSSRTWSGHGSRRRSSRRSRNGSCVARSSRSAQGRARRKRSAPSRSRCCTRAMSRACTTSAGSIVSRTR